MKKSLVATHVAIAALTLGLALAGCGSKTTTVTSSSKSDTTSTTTTTTTTSKNATKTPQASGPNPTIADYIQKAGIVETAVKRGDASAPTVNLPFPPGWVDAGAQTPDYAYGAIVASDPAFASDPPSIIAIFSKLTGNVDPAKVLEFAPGELKNLPGYEAGGDGSPSELGGFQAFQLGGTYKKDGKSRVVAQKTVVIPAQGAVYVLQLNADGSEDQMGALMEATNVIDEQTTITV